MSRVLPIALLQLIVTLIGCGEPNKSSSPPARTYGAPAARVINADEYSAPYGVHGNPYYFNHKTEKWVYFDENGRERESPLQPPLSGMRVRRSASSQPVVGKSS